MNSSKFFKEVNFDAFLIKISFVISVLAAGAGAALGLKFGIPFYTVILRSMVLMVFVFAVSFGMLFIAFRSIYVKQQHEQDEKGEDSLDIDISKIL